VSAQARVEGAEAIGMNSSVRCLECNEPLSGGGELLGHLASQHPESSSGRTAADVLNAMARGAFS